MKIGIIGVGAMASLFAGRLAPLTRVTLLGHWPAQLAALRRDGITLIDNDGQRRQAPVQVGDDAGAMPPLDLAFILVKSHQTARAAEEALLLLAANGVALTLQNGWGNRETLEGTLGVGRVALGVTSLGATLVEPGLVRQVGNEPVYLAQAPGLTRRLTDVAALLRASGLEAELVDSADSLVWGKLAVNAGINPLTALLDVPNGFLAENDAARVLMSAAAAEAAAVAAAMGVSLPYADAAARALAVAQATAANMSSMRQDIRRGARTEIDAISGAIARQGAALGVATPLNALLARLVRQREAGRRLEPDLPDEAGARYWSQIQTLLAPDLPSSGGD